MGDVNLMPDDLGGLLLANKRGLVTRVDTSDVVTASAYLVDPTATVFETEYVLGEDAAYVLANGDVPNTFPRRYWSMTTAFDPETLAVTSQGSLPISLNDPAHLRLKFALAGGGVYVSGPENAYAVNASVDASAFGAGGNASQIISGLWAGWNVGPSIGLGSDAPLADTSWPAPASTAQKTNAAVTPDIGILVKGHNVVFPYGHASLRIVPRNQDLWRQRRPNDFVNRDAHGHYFATIGAGPPGADATTFCVTNSTLKSDINRHADVAQAPNWLEKLQYVPLLEDQLIERLFERDHNYADDLIYECLPDSGTNEYNSNSYVSGLLDATDLPHPSFPNLYLWRFPGWAKPVPISEFEPATQP